jgi:RNA polymerase sigma-70 factor, ECF subfamily
MWSKVRQPQETVNLRDPGQLERAYREHRMRAFAAAMGVLRDEAAAEDVVQDVFTHLWRNPGGFDPLRASLSTYVSLLARSRALDHWRSRAVRRSAQERLADREESEPRSAAGAGETTVTREETRSALEALSTVPDDQREAVLLAYAGGLTARQIARVRGIPLGTAKSRIRLGLEKARAELEAA